MTPLVYAYRPQPDRLSWAEIAAAWTHDKGGLAAVLLAFGLVGAAYGVL